MKAAIAVQRKMLELIYILWKKEEMFDAEKYQNQTAVKEIESQYIGTLTELAQ